MQQQKVKYAELRPGEFRQRLSEKPLAYLPPLFLGPDRRMDLEDDSYLIEMDYAKSTGPNKQLTGSCYWVNYDFFKSLLENILEQLKRQDSKRCMRMVTVRQEEHGQK